MAGRPLRRARIALNNSSSGRRAETRAVQLRMFAGMPGYCSFCHRKSTSQLSNGFNVCKKHENEPPSDQEYIEMSEAWSLGMWPELGEGDPEARNRVNALRDIQNSEMVGRPLRAHNNSSKQINCMIYNPRAKRNPDTRIIYHREGCIGRGYWLTVLEVNDKSKKAKILYNDRRDDHDPYDREDSKKVRPPGEWALFNLSRSTETGKPDKIHLSIDGVKYAVKGPYFVSSHESVLPNIWR